MWEERAKAEDSPISPVFFSHHRQILVWKNLSALRKNVDGEPDFK